MSSPPKTDCREPSAEPISTHNHRDSAGSSGTSSHGENRQHAMESFKQLAMKCIIASTLNKSLTPSHNSFVNQRLQEFASRLHTPDHPTYAFMIRNAIEQLNEEGGSNEEAISQFIVEQYKDLPFAHKKLLEHHLRKLCESGDLVESRDKRYVVREVNANINPISSPSPTLDLMLIHNPSPSTSPIPNPSTSYKRSPSSSAGVSSSSSYSNDLEYMCSSTSSSEVSYSPKRNRRNKKRGNALTQGGKGLKVRSRRKKNPGKSRGRGRRRGGSRRRGGGRGRGRGRGGGRSHARRSNMKNMMEEEIEEHMMEENNDKCVDQIENVKAEEIGERGRGLGRGRPCTENMIDKYGDQIEECSRGLDDGEPCMENAMEENIVGRHADQMDK